MLCLEKGDITLDLMKNELEIGAVYVLIYSDEVCIHYSNAHCIKRIISIHCRCQEESRGREEIHTLATVDHKHHKLPAPKKDKARGSPFSPYWSPVVFECIYQILVLMSLDSLSAIE